MAGAPETRTWTIRDAGSGMAEAGTEMLPGSFAVTPGNTPNDGTFTLQLTLTLAGDSMGQPPITLRGTARSRFAPHTVGVLLMFLPLACGTVVPGLHCTNASALCSMGEFCSEMTPPQTCVSPGRCVPIEIPPVSDGGVDESTLAQGTRRAFYACTEHSQCAPGTACVDNGGDGHFFCKPLCTQTSQCAVFPFSRLRCYPAVRVDGTTFQHNLCNDNPGVLHPI